MIPKKIYITWETKELPHENMKNAFESWEEKNKNFEVLLFDKDDREKFINNYELPKKAYSLLKKNSAKVDIWRLAYLYEYGGFYTDIDQICLEPLDSFIPENSDLIWGTACYYSHIANLPNGFIGATPKNIIIKYLLDNICNNVIYTFESNNHKLLKTPGHYITGPIAIGRAFNSFIEKEINNKILPGLYDFKENKCFFIRHQGGSHFEVNNKKVIQEKYDGYVSIRDKIN